MSLSITSITFVVGNIRFEYHGTADELLKIQKSPQTFLKQYTTRPLYQISQQYLNDPQFAQLKKQTIQFANHDFKKYIASVQRNLK